MPVWLLTHWKAAVGMLTAAFLFGSGYVTRVKLDQAADDIKQHQAEEAQHQAQLIADAKAAAWETQLAALRADNKKLSGRLHNEIKKAIYSSCVVPDDGVSIYNAALSGDAAGGASGKLR